MDKKEMRKLLEQAKKQLKGFVLVEDKAFLQALINGNIETEEHKAKHKKMLSLMKRIDNIK